MKIEMDSNTATVISVALITIIIIAGMVFGYLTH